MSKHTVNVDHKLRFATGRDCLIALGYQSIGTATPKNHEPKEVFELENHRFTILQCKIELYQVKKLVIEDFTGELDGEQPPAETTDPKPDVQE